MENDLQVNFTRKILTPNFLHIRFFNFILIFLFNNVIRCCYYYYLLLLLHVICNMLFAAMQRKLCVKPCKSCPVFEY